MIVLAGGSGGGDAPLVLICSASSSMNVAAPRLTPACVSSCLRVFKKVFPLRPESLTLTQSRQPMSKRESVLTNSALVMSQTGLEEGGRAIAYGAVARATKPGSRARFTTGRSMPVASPNISIMPRRQMQALPTSTAIHGQNTASDQD